MTLRGLLETIIRQNHALGGTDHLDRRGLIADAVELIRCEQIHRGGTSRDAAIRVLFEDSGCSSDAPTRH